jgi:translation initiation factor 3 subunit B
MAVVLRPDEEKLFEGQPKGFPFGDFDIDDVMLPEGDDMGFPSDDEGADQEDEVKAESGFGNVVGACFCDPHPLPT